MKILFTGGSSFTGYWFIKTLVKRGHEVQFTLTRPTPSEYEGIRGERVERLLQIAEPHCNCTFGSDPFMDVLTDEGPWDIFCHHAAYTHDHRSPDFPVARALEANTHNLPGVLTALRERKCKNVILTGSYYEQGEGTTDEGQRAISPYGLSKGFTYQCFRYWCRQHNMSLGKFVIPNPFGPLEPADCFTSHLAEKWANDETAEVRTPNYVRDNIHVDLLSLIYTHFAEHILTSEHSPPHCAPSGYVEKQGEFARRCSQELRSRLDLPCKLILTTQTNYEQPKTCYNKGYTGREDIQWNEGTAWDELEDYYRRRHLK